MALRGEELRTRLMATFRPEAREHLATIHAELLAVEQGASGEPARAAAEALFRAFHTLKGAARSVGLGRVEELAQACESVLSGVTRGQADLDPPALAGLRAVVGGIARMVEEGEGTVDVHTLVARLAPPSAAALAGAPESARSAPGAARLPGGAPARDSLRVGTAKLDALLVRAEELLGPKLAAQERAREALDLARAVSACRRALLQLGAPGLAERRNDAAATLDADLRAAEARARELGARVRRDARSLGGAVDALESEARRLRLSPAATMLEAFPHMVRDLGESRRKEVEWVVEGAAVDVDRKVLEAVKDPLIHLVRNAVDHAIEAPAERERAGKRRRGRVRVALEPLEGGRLRIRVEDDGAGFDREGLKSAAVRGRQMAASDVAVLDDQQVLDLAFRAGLSTAPVITAISGHGRGLAIVRERVEQLGGQVQVETRPGQGTSVVMVVPTAVATFRGLLVRAGEQLFLVPLEAVESVGRLAAGANVRMVEGQETLVQGDRSVPVCVLAAQLELPATREEGAARTLVFLTAGGSHLALDVDEVLGEREVVVKELGWPLLRVRYVAAAGLLASGALALILRPADLVRFHAAHRPPTSPAAASARPVSVLLVDDSITTRAMEQSLLEAAGYRVQVAVDGVDAWTALRTGSFDLVVSDVDMPRMDGFELTRRIREDRSLADLPVVLVTALESREDKERGVAVGANAYVVKSSFDQSNLLEILRRLV